MKSHIPSIDSDYFSRTKIEHIAVSFSEEPEQNGQILICDAYLWTAPDRSTICTSIILPCPKCEYPIILKPDQLALTLGSNGITLNQKISCPSRWKQMDGTIVDTDEDGNPIHIRCGWSCRGIEHSKIRSNKNGET
jgi:hypothetical protein